MEVGGDNQLVGRDERTLPGVGASVRRLPGDEMVGQQDDVAPPLAQRRQVERKDVQTVKKVGPEPSRGEILLEVAIRCGDDPDIDADHAGGAERLELLFLEHPEQFGLGRRGEFPDLVEKNRPPVRLLETASPLVDGAGKGPPLVAEKFALDQRVGNGRAVDLDKRPLEAGAVFVDRAGNQFLARPRLPDDQYRRIRIGHLGNHAEVILHQPGMADDLRRGRPGTAQEMAEAPVFLFKGF